MSAVDEAAVTAKSGGLGVIWGVVAEYCLLCPKKCAIAWSEVRMNVADRDILIATYHASVPKLILGDRRHLSALTPEFDNTPLSRRPFSVASPQFQPRLCPDRRA